MATQEELKLEQRLVELGLNGPRITPTKLDALIKDVKFHVFEDTCLTVCCIVLENGFTVVGESACASPENFNQKVGEEIAFLNAREKIWSLEGYLLRQKLHTIDKLKENQILN